MSNLEKMLVAVRSGEIDFGEFVASTRKEFRSMAGYLSKRWKPPEWFTLDDIEQELYLGAWKYVWTYESTPHYGATHWPTLSRYVVFNAMACAKTQLHKSRGVTISGSPDRKLSNIETPLTFFGDGDTAGETLLASLLAEDPKAEEVLADEEVRQEAVAEALEMCQTPHERYAVLAIREAGSLDEAGKCLHDNFDHRITLRLGSEEQAERFVAKHSRAVAGRMKVMAARRPEDLDVTKHARAVAERMVSENV